MIFTAEATLTGIRYLTDGGLGLTFKTQDIDLKQRVLIGEYFNKFGTVAFRESAIEPEEIPDAESHEGKTPSQRLRAVLFVQWRQQVSHTGIAFNDWYPRAMEQIIAQCKRVLEDE